MPDGAVPEYAWLALLDHPHGVSVPVLDATSGAPAGHLIVVAARAKPDRAAVRVAPEVLGDGLPGDGPELAVSLVLPPRGQRPLFDDPAVVHAMKAVLRDPGRATTFSTLVDGLTQWAGALSGIVTSQVRKLPEWWRSDPFARLGPQHRLLVPAGLLRAVPLPVGPAHQRHSGSPWPWGQFG